MTWWLWLLVSDVGAFLLFGLVCVIGEVITEVSRPSPQVRAAAADWRIHQITEQAKQEMWQAVHDSER